MKNDGELVEYLKKQKKELVVDIREKVNDQYMSLIVENVKDIRETVRNLSVTSSAIAALSLTLYDKSMVKSPFLLTGSLFLMLLCTWSGYYYLKKVLESESETLHQNKTIFNSELTKVRQQLDRAIQKPSKENVRQYLEVHKNFPINISAKFESSKEGWYERFPDIMFWSFSIGIVFLVLSFLIVTRV